MPTSCASLVEGVTILVHNRQIALAAVVRVICNLTLYGFPVIMPLYLATTNNGGGAWFKVSQWSQIWGFQFVVTIFGNVFWGRMGDSHGWMRQMRWFGCWFCVIGTLGIVYIPSVFGANMVLMCADAVVLGLGISAFVPMGAVFPALASEHKGAAISAHNLASGLTTFFRSADCDGADFHYRIRRRVLDVLRSAMRSDRWSRSAFILINLDLTIVAIALPRSNVTNRN